MAFPATANVTSHLPRTIIGVVSDVNVVPPSPAEVRIVTGWLNLKLLVGEET